MSPEQTETPTSLPKPTKPLVVELEKEWENFNELIDTEAQSVEPPTNLGETTIKMVVEGVTNTQEIEHILVAPSFEIILKIEDSSYGCIL